MTLEQLIGQRDALEKSIYGGVRSTSYDGSTIEYRTTEEMQSALSQLNGRIADLQAPQRSRIFTVKTNRGI